MRLLPRERERGICLKKIDSIYFSFFVILPFIISTRMQRGAGTCHRF